MFNIVKHRYWYFIFSALVVVPGLVALARYGLPRSIDFTGGTLMELKFEAPQTDVEAKLADVFAAHGFDAAPQVVEAADPATGEKRYQIRSRSLSQVAEAEGSDQTTLKQELYAAIEAAMGKFEEVQFTDVGPSVGAEVTRNAMFAVALAAIGILVYLTFVFRNVPHPIRYGVCAIIAMLHDVLVVVGLASIMGVLYKWEVDALFLTALLTVIGFSVHDTIVVFDRIRENVGRMRGLPFDRVVNHSIIQTLDRSINTQMTAVLTLFAILVFSQGQLRTFVFWLIIGIVSGTYSSIFNAAQLLVVWENREWRHWFGRGRAEASASAA
ncbi:protein translocase subunit SecF [bacterium]|nr:protein translocase subunit SecF [Chloroflexi bacterium CFX6]RIL10242.1 MAG: protein translocase subunit SecF [bacterium]